MVVLMATRKRSLLTLFQLCDVPWRRVSETGGVISTPPRLCVWPSMRVRVPHYPHACFLGKRDIYYCLDMYPGAKTQKTRQPPTFSSSLGTRLRRWSSPASALMLSGETRSCIHLVMPSFRYHSLPLRGCVWACHNSCDIRRVDTHGWSVRHHALPAAAQQRGAQWASKPPSPSRECENAPSAHQLRRPLSAGISRNLL